MQTAFTGNVLCITATSPVCQTSKQPVKPAAGSIRGDSPSLTNSHADAQSTSAKEDLRGSLGKRHLQHIISVLL